MGLRRPTTLIVLALLASIAPATAAVAEPVSARSGSYGFSSCGPNLRPAFTVTDAGYHYALAAIDQATSTDAWGVGLKYRHQAYMPQSWVAHWHGRLQGDAVLGAAWLKRSNPRQPLDSQGNVRPNAFAGVAGLPSGEVFAVGWARTGPGVREGLVEHHEVGGPWTIESPVDPGGSFAFLGAAADEVGNAWAVGWRRDDGGFHPLAERRDATGWAVVGDGFDSGEGRLRSVHAFGPDDVWAVGDTADGMALAVHWDGASWSPTVVPISGGGVLAGITGVAGDDVWAVGWTGATKVAPSALAVHWDGQAWAQFPVELQAGNTRLLAVDTDPTGSLFAVGDALSGSEPEPLAVYWAGGVWRSLDTGAAGEVDAGSLTGVAIFAGHLTAGSDGDLDFAYGGCPIQVGSDGFSLTRERYAGWDTQVVFSVAAGEGSPQEVVESGGLFDSGPIPPGASWTFRLRGAGTYRLGDLANPSAQARIVSRMCCAFGFGSQHSEFDLAWANRRGNARRAYDVQIQRPGATDFVPWLTGATKPRTKYVPDGTPPGPGEQVQYLFRARVRNPMTGGASDWSPPTGITVVGFT